VDENTNTNEVSALKKTITEQKENFTNREKHVLHLEKKLALLEHENSKNKKQVSSFREKLKDCSGTVDYLRREKEVLASERDRLSFTLLTSEHELKELRSQNINLVTEYESAEHSRKIAVSHLQEVERVCHESHQEKPDHTVKRKVGKSSRNSEKNSEKLIAQFNSMKEAVRKLRLDREALQNEQNKVRSFFAENLKNLLDQVQDIKSQREKVPGNNPQAIPEDSRHEVTPSEQVTLNVDVFLQSEEPTADSEDVSNLDGFKKKLKSNEQCIDELANQIRDLENRKKDLLETRFAMIQEFQVGRGVLGDWEADMSGNDTEDKVESETEGKNDFHMKLVARTSTSSAGCISLNRQLSCETYTRKNAQQVCKQVVTSLLTSCQQVVFALLVPSCCNKFGTSC
jgi:DNA repair exonuclease SbcCD ATPase subunit